MSYQVLARKWRPGNFSQMVGQDHVLRALINALDNDRLHHAFLFTGTRGVGKTTVARILAKSLNCDRGVSSTPCGECSSCVEIDAGNFVDLIEVDAASRTKVEDTRELLDNVLYMPTRGRYKVYLIDEVHMLTKHSFNALLKTLEEPPAHIKFLLATTDPQKLPATILSRCLQFNLTRMSKEQISAHLDYILTEEKIDSESEALKQLAHAADGSMRDALSLLDQAIAFTGGEVNNADVATMLGTIDRGHTYALLDALLENDGAALMQAVQLAAEQSCDFSALFEDLLSLLHRIAMAQQIPEMLESNDDELGKIKHYISQFNAEDIQLYYQIGLIGRRDLPLAPDPRSGFEMVMLRMLAFNPMSGQPVKSRAGSAQAKQKPVPVSKPKQASSPLVSTASAVAKPESAEPVATTTAETSEVNSQVAAPPVNALSSDWGEIVQALALKGMAGQLAMNSQLLEKTEKLIRLQLDDAHAHLANDTTRVRLEKALQEYFGKSLKLIIDAGLHAQATPAVQQQHQRDERQRAAEDEINNDENVKKLQQVFNARVQNDTIQPVDG